MAKKFTESEKAAVREKLRSVGRELFIESGLQKTAVADIASRVGVAPGTFYLFYASKEALFFDILQLEEERIRTSLIDTHLASEKPMTRERFEAFLLDSMVSVAAHPLLRHLNDERVMAQLFRKLPPETLAAHAEHDTEALAPWIRKGQREGWLANIEPGAIVGVIRSLVLLSFQKERIGEEVYEPTLRLLARFAAQGMIVET